MPLLPMGGAAHLYDGGVMFYMNDGGKVVKVKVDRDALNRLAGPGRSQDAAVVQKHRSRIEYKAALKYEAHFIEADGTILIGADDLA